MSSVYLRHGQPNMASSVEAKKPRGESANMKALRDLKQGMDSNAKFGKMVMYSVECMGRMAVDQVSVEEIAQSGCIQSALTACNQNAKNHMVQNSVNTALLRACYDDHCVNEVSKAIDGNFSSFALSLSEHSDRDTTLSNAKLLGKLARAPPPEGPRNIAEMKRLGIYDLLAKKVMECPDDDLEMLAALADTLATGADDPVIAQMLIDTGVFQKLLNALAKNPSNKALAQAVANLIGQACLAGDNIIAQLKDMGALSVLAHALQANPNDKDLINAVARALAFLSDANDLAQIVASLSVPNQTWESLCAATARLAALTLVPAHLAYFKSGQGSDKLVHVLQQALAAGFNVAHAVDAATQSMLAMSRICKGGEHNVYGLMRAGAVATLTAALQALLKAAQSTEDPARLSQIMDGVIAGLAAVRSMMTRKENMSYLETNGAILAAIQAASPFLDNVAVATALAELCLSALQFPDTLSSATKQAMIDAMLSVLAKHPDNAFLTAMALDALNKLAGSEDEERAIIQGGIIPLIFAALKKHSGNRDVVKAALIAMDLALMLPEGQALVDEDELRKLLRNLKKTWGDDDEICELFNSVNEGLAAKKQGGNASLHDEIVTTNVDTPASGNPISVLPGVGEGLNSDLLDILAKLKLAAGEGTTSTTETTKNEAPYVPWFNGILQAAKKEEAVESAPPMALHIMESFNKIQQYLTERRAAKLLNMFEVLCHQPQSYDRDYLSNAVLDAISAIAEEAVHAESAFAAAKANGEELDAETKALLHPDGSGIALVLRDLESGIVQHSMGERVCDRILAATTDEDIIVMSDNFATLLSLVDRDSCRIVCASCGLLPQAYANVATEEVPYQTSNPLVDATQRMYAIEDARKTLEEMRLALEEAERQRQLALKQQREMEVLRLKALSQSSISADNQAVLDRIARAKAEAEEKSRLVREEMAQRLAEAKAEQERKLLEMNAEAERKRLQQIQELREAARAATLAKVELEMRLAETGVDSKYQGKALSKDVVSILDPALKQFMITGGLITKHNALNNNTRHLYLTPNCEYLVWRPTGSSDVKPSHMMKITKFQLVRAGRVTAVLKGVKNSAITEKSGSVNLPGTQTTEAAASDSNIGGSPFFAVYGVDMTGRDLELSFEAPTVEAARKWVRALDHLAAFARHLNQFHGEDTLNMHSNPLYNIIRAEKKYAVIEDSIEKNLLRADAAREEAKVDVDGSVASAHGTTSNVHDRLSAVIGEEYEADEAVVPASSAGALFSDNGNFCEDADDF